MTLTGHSGEVRCLHLEVRIAIVIENLTSLGTVPAPIKDAASIQKNVFWIYAPCCILHKIAHLRIVKIDKIWQNCTIVLNWNNNFWIEAASFIGVGTVILKSFWRMKWSGYLDPDFQQCILQNEGHWAEAEQLAHWKVSVIPPAILCERNNQRKRKYENKLLRTSDIS